MTTLTVLIIVIVVVVLLAAVIGVMMSKRAKEQKRAHAEQLRSAAATQAPTIDASHRDAQEAEARAEVARAEAERAERQAAEARQGAQFEQARQEDAVRQADRIDPDVDHRSDDYAPATPVQGTPAATESTTGTSGGTYAAEETHPAGGTGTTDPAIDPAVNEPGTGGTHRAPGTV